MDEEKQYLEQALEEGVELPDTDLPADEGTTDTKPEEETPTEDESVETDDAEKSTLKETEEDADSDKEDDTSRHERKRSIYDEYKEKKSELKSERELRLQMEEKNRELEARLAQFGKENPEETKAEITEDIEAFAVKIGADAETLKEMKRLFLKGVTPEKAVDDETLKALEEFREWKQVQKQQDDVKAFEEEFNSVLPQLRTEYPNATDTEIKSIKQKLDELAHTKDFHDKELEYVLYKNKDTIATLVSPKKRGIETRQPVDMGTQDFEFDPNADVTKLSPKQQEMWMKEYEKMSSSDELTTDREGRRILI